MSKYDDWIKSNVTESYGKCEVVTEAMQEAFPELQRVRGHYYCPIWSERQHWWLVDPEGRIVDPTKSQFPSKGLGVYEPWVDGTPEPTGMCANCGGMVYDGGTTCSEDCHAEYVAYCCSF